MPAKENSILIQNEAKLIRKDVDNLVQNIKENLNLTHYEHQQTPSVQFSSGGCNNVLSTQSYTELPEFDYPSVSSDPTHNQNSFKARSCISRGSRASPYGVVSSKKCDCLADSGAVVAGGVKRSSWAARKRYPSMSANGKTKAVELDDTLEMLHELIRFLTLISHFVLTLTVLMGREDNVLACLPLDHTPLQLSRKDTELAAGLGVTIALLAIEMIGFLSGLTMFSPLQSLLSIGTHATATIALAYLILDIWDCNLFWWIFSVCSCFPAVVELTIIVGVLGLKKNL